MSEAGMAGTEAARVAGRPPGWRRPSERLRPIPRESPAPTEPPEPPPEPIDGLVGRSPALRRVQDLIARLGPAPATVLVSGESGTGKELVARALHARGAPDRPRPFVAVNCAALPEPLLESELFGHVRGAFTGAQGDKRGLFEAAGDGTLFLDEISELPHALQAKLLRALEAKEVRPVGALASRPFDARIVCASNRDLAAEARAGRFRADLYFRVNVAEIGLPPLRERREDVPLLVEHFRRRAARELGREAPAVDDEALAALMAYDWPGNVRELAHVIERCVLLGDGPRLRRRDLPPALLQPAPPPPSSAPTTLRAAVRRAEAQCIEAALTRTGGDRTAAARVLGIGVSSLYRKMRALGIE